MTHLEEKRTILRRATDRGPAYQLGPVGVLLAIAASWALGLLFLFCN
jgi:hypothetical protein